MGKEFPVASGIAFQGLQTPRQLHLRQDRSLTSRLFGQIHYKVIGRLTAMLDYVLIVTASIMVGLGNYSVEEHVLPNLMPYLGAGNIVAALFILGTAARGNYSPSAIVSARGQVRSVMSFWSLAFLSLAFFLFLA